MFKWVEVLGLMGCFLPRRVKSGISVSAKSQSLGVAITCRLMVSRQSARFFEVAFRSGAGCSLMSVPLGPFALKLCACFR